MAAITRIWILLNLITMLRLVCTQIPYPMYPLVGPPMFGMPPAPPPMAFAMPVPIAVRIEQISSTSTSTTEQSIAVAVPVPLPMPMHIAVPAMPPPVNCQQRSRPYNCPPCPPCMCSPSCTPAFFAYCSPCHQKCKCRPLASPRYNKKYHRKSSCSGESDSSYTSSSSSSEWVSDRRRIRRRNKRKSLHNMRRNFQISDMETSGNELVKPVLTYISRNGDIKFKKRISTDEAAQLLGEKRNPKIHQNIKVISREDNNGKSQVVVVSKDVEETFNGNSHRQVILREGTGQHRIGEGITFDLGNGLGLNDFSLFDSKNVKLSDIFSMDGPRGEEFPLKDLPKSFTTNEQKPLLKKPTVNKKDKKETFLKMIQANTRTSANARKNTHFEKKPNLEKKVSKSPAKVEVTSTTSIPQDYNRNPGNVQCCNGMTCFSPCPYPMMHSPIYPVPPILVPVRSYFEPVIHDHPPLKEIKRMIKADRRRKKKQRYMSSNSETEYSDTSSSEIDSFEYYNDFIHVN